MTEKYDAKKALPELYRGKAEWMHVTVPERNYLSVLGEGSPDAPAYAEALEALYGVAYTLKFTLKARGNDFVVAPLESLWFADDMSVYSADPEKDSWKWRSLIPLPPFVTPADVGQAREDLRQKKSPAALDRLEFFTLNEGECLQYLWVGAYSDEYQVLTPLHEGGLEAMGLREAGEHHEIYLSDPRRTESAKLKTLLRQPVAAL